MIDDKHKKGALTELRCAAELIKRDWHVAFPFVHQSRIDLIAYRDDRFITIQVKSGNLMKGQWAEINSVFDQYTGVDFIVCYDLTHRRWFIFPFQDLEGRRSVTLSPKRYARNCDNWALIR